MIAVANATSRFFAWWLGELIACVPDHLRSLLRRKSSMLVVTLGTDSAHFCLRREGRIRRLGQIPTSTASRQALVALFSGAPPRSSEIVVNVPADKVLRRSLRLPLEAAENLREVLAFQMERYTPFKASEIAYDYRVTATDIAARKVAVDLAILPRATFEQATSIADLFGLAADRIGIVDDHEQERSFNFRPYEESSEPQAAQRRFFFAFTMAAAILIVVASCLPLYFNHRALTAYEARLSEARTAALQAETLKKRLTAAMNLSRVLIGRRAQTPTITSLLADITDRLPDDTWLTQLQIREGTLTISGVSSSSAPLISRLEASPFLAQVRFGSPVTSDSGVDGERFDIMAQVMPDQID
jgi:general secretion pathway protein L